MTIAIVGYSKSSTDGHPYFVISGGFLSQSEAQNTAKREQFNALSDGGLQYLSYSDDGNLQNQIDKLNGVYFKGAPAQSQVEGTITKADINAIANNYGLEIVGKIDNSNSFENLAVVPEIATFSTPNSVSATPILSVVPEITTFSTNLAKASVSATPILLICGLIAAAVVVGRRK